MPSSQRTAKFWRALLNAAGWRIEGAMDDAPTCVIIAAPHTSNWDFVLAMVVMRALGVHVHWIGKHTLFRWPFGAMLRCLGGIPVRRDRPQGMVADMVQRFAESDSFRLGLSPEGTRKCVTSWRTGFYHIALGARVPIVCAYFDYPRRVVGFAAPYEPIGDAEADMAHFRAFYAPYQRAGKRSGLS